MTPPHDQRPATPPPQRSPQPPSPPQPHTPTKAEDLPAVPSEAGPLPSLPDVASFPHLTPHCPHFGPCGGCQLQDRTSPTQLAEKQDILRQLLTGLPLPPIHVHAAEPWLYRNRIRIRLEPDPAHSHAFRIGYNRAQTNDFLPIHTCPIAAPSLLHAAQALTALAPTDSTVALWLVVTAQIELFTNPDESVLQVQLFLRDKPRTPDLSRSFATLFQTLQQHLPSLSGIGAEPLQPTRANTHTPRPSPALSSLPPLAAGRPGLLYPVPLDPTSPALTNLWVSRGSFFQVNRHLLPTLLHTALRAAHLPASPRTLPLAWDLFAGVGLFARALAPFFDRITAVEAAPSAVADLRSARLPSIDLVESAVLDFLRRAVISRDRPSLVLLDPPRAGLGPEATGLLLRIRPPRIVYVSCDPTTLARDLRAMLSSGYILAELHMVDMFPQTAHLEAIAVLTSGSETSL